MSDLLTQPLWQADSLGSPLPDNEFGVSVSLPLWQHVVGYEEGDVAVTSQFRSGYPRFFLPPQIAKLFEVAEQQFAREGERCLVFPRAIHAQRCVDFAECGGRVESFGELKLGVAVIPAEAYTAARKYWRFAGEVVSARQSLQALGIDPLTTKEEGYAASKILRERLAGLSGQNAEDVFLFPSGMAATFAVHRMLLACFPGRKTVQLDFPYVDVLKVQQMFGTGAHFFPLVRDAEYDELKSLLTDTPVAGIFSEVPTNPLLRSVDYTRLQTLLSETQPDTPLVIDDTIGTVANVDAFRVADVVTTSLTKAFSGAGDVMAGSVIINKDSRHHAAFSAFLREHADNELFHADAIVLEQNSREFADRAMVMSRNSVGLHEYLSKHPKVARVWHSVNEGGAGYQLLQRNGGGHSGMFSMLLKDPAASPVFYDALAICKGPSLGTNFTLACPYTLLAHYEELDWAESCGVPRHLIRVSAGLEPLGDLVARFERALAAA
ncbi:MAG: Cystathionine gamma-synthase [Verrucomicrobiaceae bacterium]|nr:Cystathionine gamma-synthase [Verrucomicrobiaceae bacterium]